MKKIFTLISMALVAMGVNAQTTITYNAATADGLADEFKAVVDGTVANNVVDGKSVVEIKRGSVTVIAIGGTTPADAADNSTDTPPQTHVDINADGTVNSWNKVEWKTGNNRPDKGIYCVNGTGNPYVALSVETVMTDGAPATYYDDENVEHTKYRPVYTYYEPDGSKGLPITGLYYKFTSTEKGAFKVAVWANKGNRRTFVVKEATAKAQKLYTEGYINGQNDSEGQLRYLTNEEIEEIHNNAITTEKTNAANKKKSDEVTPYYTDEELSALYAEIDAKYADVIGAGNQHFWGYLFFDVEPNETVWVFQHSSQIGFAGFEFTPGKASEDLLNAIESIKTVAANANAPLFNLAGQKVSKSYKGVVIQNGKKMVLK